MTPIGAGRTLASDPESAVNGLLSAVVDGESSTTMCRFLASEELPDDASAWMADLTTSTETMGGVGNLDVTVLPAQQMGAEHRVDVRAGAGSIAEFAVIERNGAFTVSITGSTKVPIPER